MDKVKKKFLDMSIKNFLIITMIITFLVAFIIINIQIAVLENIQYDIAFKYVEKIDSINDKRVGNGKEFFYFSKTESNVMKITQFFIIMVPTFSYAICIISSSIFLYQFKLKKPIKLLKNASEEISNQNLDFTIDYIEKDEMGILCQSFEKMKEMLKQNYQDMWRQTNDRKRLNAAFSHDLRTPMAVLRGQMELLYKYSEHENFTEKEKKEVYIEIFEQIDRLENYVSAMSTLQRLEDFLISTKDITVKELVNSLENVAVHICKDKTILFNNKCEKITYHLDFEVVMQVYENILSNAIRYAKSYIDITLNDSYNFFSIAVCDDGEGFTYAALKTATDPFYSTEKQYDASHFGLGLNIAKILCEKHGGKITLENSPKAGANVTVLFSSMK